MKHEALHRVLAKINEERSGTMKISLKIVAVLSGIVFCVCCVGLMYCQKQATDLLIEGENFASPANNFDRNVRTIIDGLTLGLFASEGPFTEAKKEYREGKRLCTQSNLLEQSYNSFVFFRNISLFIFAGSTIGLLWLKRRDFSVGLALPTPGADVPPPERQ